MRAALTECLPDELLKETDWISYYKAMADNWGRWQEAGYLSLDDIRDANILDFGGDTGQLAVLLLQNGAKQATVIDTCLPTDLYDTKLRAVENLRYSTLTVENLSEVAEEVGKYDLIVSHTVTEHVQNLASAFTAIHKLLSPNGLFFVVHDNYYHPSGAHDNIMLHPNGEGIYEYLGPKCWESENRCEYSREFRKTMIDRMPWGWDDRAETMLTPLNCKACLFRKRTRPWAHLLYQSQFNAIFPQECFTTGKENSLLNKVTPFQLKQHIIEAGFGFELWKRTSVKNPLPPELLASPHYCNEFDLKTLNIYARCRKAESLTAPEIAIDDFSCDKKSVSDAAPPSNRKNAARSIGEIKSRLSLKRIAGGISRRTAGMLRRLKGGR